MTRVSICEIDRIVTKGKIVPVEKVLPKVVVHIKKNIDDTFPEDKFMDWINSDSEKNFVWNSRSYAWGE